MRKITYLGLFYDNITIRLKGIGNPRKISLSSNSEGSLFIIRTGVTLILEENIILVGINNNTRPLIDVDGKLIMNDGKISGNKSPNGGGVSVYGTFIMNGGEISGNNSSEGYGGGVCVHGGTFTMNGGKISSNTSPYYGGGVFTQDLKGNGTYYNFYHERRRNLR